MAGGAEEEEGMPAMLPCTWPQGGAHLGSLVPSLQFSLAAPDTGSNHLHSQNTYFMCTKCRE